MNYQGQFANAHYPKCVDNSVNYPVRLLKLTDSTD